MAVVLALCLGGCGKNIPKADYSFSAKDFVTDCLHHDNELLTTIEKANKIYKNKRIEISGKIFFKLETGGDFLIVFDVPLHDVFIFKVSVRDKNVLDKLKEGDSVKMSCLFGRIACSGDNGIKFFFEFTDGVLIEKM